MPSRSEGVQPTSWLINNELPDVLRYVRVLSLPTPILQSIQSLNAHIPEVPPFASLNDALATFSRDIIAFHPYSTLTKDTRRWLYARMGSSLDPSRLQKLIKAWLIACYGASQANALIKGWGQVDWVWDTLDLQQAHSTTKRMLLPGLVARWLLDQGYVLTLEENGRDTPMPLHLVPLMTQRYVAELLTAPRSYNEERFSIVLRLWLAPMPGAVCLLTRASVRRWYDKPVIENGTVYLKRGQRKSVYLRRSTGYLDMPANDSDELPVDDDVYTRITMKYVGGGEKGLLWVGNQSRVFNELRVHGEPPPIVDFARQPNQYYDQALIVMQNRHSRMQEVETGLQPADHRRIFDDLNARMMQWAAPMPLWSRVLAGDPAPGESTPSRNPDSANTQEQFQGLLQMQHPVRIELQTSDTSGAKAALLEAVGLAEQYKNQLGQNPLCIIHENKTLLEIVHGTDSRLTALLPESANQSAEARQRASQDRRSDIARRYKIAEQPTGAFISIPPYHQDSATNNRDPKTSIRYGLIDSGRVSQFFEPRRSREKDDSYTRRLKNAARDLLRVLGYRLDPYCTPTGKLPEQVDLLVLYVMQLNARGRGEQKVVLPLMAEAPAGSHQLRLYVPRATGSADLYMTLREGIIAAAGFQGDFTEPEVTRFFRDAINLRQAQSRRENRQAQPALMLVVDQNLRRVFPELDVQDAANPTISLNNILNLTGQIRVARLRFSANGEVAHCVPENRVQGKYQGLYSHADFPYVFYSLHNIGERHMSGKYHKLDKVGDAAVNSSTVQIWLNNLQENDDAGSWAALVHNLRRASSHTSIATIFPQPLHDLLTIPDYISRLAEDETDDDLNALEANEGSR